MSTIPSSVTPKNVQSGIAGALAVGTVWAWNTWQSVQTCPPHPSMGKCFELQTKWFLEDPVSGAVILVIVFITGPVIRKYQAWGERNADKAQDMKNLVDELKKVRTGE